MKKTIFFIFLFLPYIAFNQNNTSLEMCYEAAKNNHPLVSETELNSKVEEISLEKIATTWLPKIDAYAQAMYVSDVVELNIDIPMFEMPELTHDQYKVAVTVQQMLFDGTSTSYRKELQQAQTEIDNKTVEVKLYSIKEQVATAYFGILFLQEQEKLMLNVMEELKTQQKRIATGIENGVLLPMSADILEVEVLKTEQKIIEIRAAKNSGLQTLNVLTGQNFDENSQLQIPENNNTAQGTRPEMLLFEAQKNYFSATSNLVTTQRLPMAFAFGEFGYGKPGLNMLSNTFDTYYTVGVKVTWNIYDWNNSNREKQLIEVYSEKINHQEELFTRSQTIVNQQQQQNLEKLQQLMEKDQQILDLRTRIKNTAANQLENGTISSTDYITELNAETQARISLELHKIQLQQEVENMRITQGSTN